MAKRKSPSLFTAMPSFKPSLCVVVCIHNAPDYAEICIESVLKHTNGDYELILVNDGSKQATSDIIKSFVRRYDHIKLIHHTTAKGYTMAANAGLKASKADYTVLLNSDTIVSPGWADRLMECGESSDSIGIIGPLSNAATYQSVPFVFEADGTWKQNILPGDITVSAYAQAVGRVSLRAYPRVPVANGFCFCVKRALIDTIGYLDEETFPRGYGEENDYCLRAADAGFEVVVADDAYVYHATSKSFGIKAREQLTREAHHAIRAKYSEERLNGIDQQLRNHDTMDQVRKRILEYVHHAQSSGEMKVSRIEFDQPNQALSFLFLLPDCAAKAGGTQVVVETARGLARMGVPVKIAAKTKIRSEYEGFFPVDSHLFFYYDKEPELLVFAKDYQVVIATIFHSIRQLKKIAEIYPKMMPAYYVQDYEPWFLDDEPKLKALAEESYTMIEGNRLFALSPWVQQIIAEKHGQQVHKVRGSLDQSLFYPDYDLPSTGTLSITAMIRPQTPWRAPDATMRLFKQLHDTHGDTIDIRIFGCSDYELEHYGLPTDFNYTNYGILNRYDVASLLRRSHIFIDLSEFQAFGRTALEAMASGCAVLAPERGGVHDFGRHEQNLLLVNTEDEIACLEAANRLVMDADLRQRLRASGIQTGLDYSIHRATLSFLELMQQLYRESQQCARQAA